MGKEVAQCWSANLAYKAHSDPQLCQDNNKKPKPLSQVCWCMSIIPVLRRLRQEDCEFKASQAIYSRTLS
jgi:hypothetical protein